MLPMDAGKPSIEDGSEARHEAAHACCESEGGSSDDSSAMCCCCSSSTRNGSLSATANGAGQMGDGDGGNEGGDGEGWDWSRPRARVSTPEGGLKGQGGKLEGVSRRKNTVVLRRGAGSAVGERQPPSPTSSVSFQPRSPTSILLLPDVRFAPPFILTPAESLAPGGRAHP